jgi:prevent-host-death family protein
MKTASITEAKNRLSALLNEVRAGETIVITDRGVPIARLEPAASYTDDDDGRIARLQRAGILSPPRNPGGIQKIIDEPPPRANNGADIVQAVLDERREGR